MKQPRCVAVAVTVAVAVAVHACEGYLSTTPASGIGSTCVPSRWAWVHRSWTRAVLCLSAYKLDCSSRKPSLPAAATAAATRTLLAAFRWVLSLEQWWVAATRHP